MKFYYEKVQALMEEKGFSKNKLAVLIGVTQPAVAAWLNGTALPRERNVYLIAKALKVLVNDISDLEEVENLSAEISGYFQGWGASLDKKKAELEDPCIRAIKEIENIKSEQYRLRTVTNAFMSTMQSMLYVKNFYGKYIVANESYLKAIRLDININIIGKQDKDIMSQRVAGVNNTQDMSIINTGNPIINKSVKFPFPDKKIKWCIMTKVPLRDSKQNIVGVVASFTDITEVYELRKHDRMLNEAIKQSNSAVGIVSGGSSGKSSFVYANEALEEMLGYDSNAFKNDMFCWLENVLEDSKEDIEKYIDAYKEEFRTISFYYMHPISGEKKFLTIKSSRVKRTDLIYHCLYDDTENKIKEQQKEQLQKSFRLLTAFIDNMENAVFISEFVNGNKSQLKYVYRNKKTYEYIDENRTLRDVYVPEQRDEILEKEKSDKYPRVLRYNITKRNLGICSVEEKIWLQNMEGSTFIFSIIVEIEKQNNVEIIFPDSVNALS